MIDPSADRALYQRIADDLRNQIRSGRLPPGAQLPSEKDLRAMYSAGQHAIRDALRVLVGEGLIVKRAGAATRVRHTHEMSHASFPPGHKVGARRAKPAECERWGLPPGSPVLTVHELVDGEWIEVESYPADRFLLGPDDDPRG